MSGHGFYASLTDAERELRTQEGIAEERKDRRERKVLLYVSLAFVWATMIAAGYAVSVYAGSSDAWLAAFLTLLALHSIADYQANRLAK